ncbi:MAG: arsenite methyltransferase [Anaerolineae bacterium]|nr:arsenite methyltransferase [Anaerolineae bacterium]
MSDIAGGDKIKKVVRQTYGGIAGRVLRRTAEASCCGPAPSPCCCGPSEATAALADIARIYTTDELAGLPESVTSAALGCGNPVALAELKPGEVVLDLGSGGGIDCFLAAQKVGPQGRVIGVDMTPEMILLAQRNAKKVGATNVEFRYGEMENIPLPDESVDVIISNCVINLSLDKDAVFREAYRVLRPGGRMSISDIVLYGELPPAIRERPDAWAACVAGALQESEYVDKMRAAGFERIEVLSRDFVEPDSVIASVRIKAYKPGPGNSCT